MLLQFVYVTVILKIHPGTYLIAEVLECEGEHFPLGHSSYAEVEPSLVVLAIHVRGCVTGHPNVKEVFLVASLGLGHIAAAKLTAEHDL